MRNRKAIIVSFLVVACLLIGVGYAAITGSLHITGNTFFYSANETGAQVHQAVKFKSAFVSDLYKDVCKASITGDDTADLAIVFTDTNLDVTDSSYTAIAKYEVVYETSDAALPEVEFSVPTLTAGGSRADYTFWLDEACTSNQWTEEDDVILAPSADAESYETFSFYVKVVFTEDGTETGILKAFPQITLNYSGE